MPTRTARTELNHVAVELRKLARLAPAEQEDRLRELSERLVEIAYELQGIDFPATRLSKR